MIDLKELLESVWTVPYLTRESAAKEAIIRTAKATGNNELAEKVKAMPSYSKIVVTQKGGIAPILYINNEPQIGLIGLAERGKKCNIKLVEPGYSYSPLERNITPTGATTKVSFAGTKITATEPPPPNKAPVVNAGADKVVIEGEMFSLTATASDADNDPLTYKWAHPPGCECNELDKPVLNVHGLPVGVHEFTVTVSDGKASVSDKVVVTVKAKEVPTTKKYKVQIYIDGGVNPVLHLDEPLSQIPVTTQPIVFEYEEGAHVHPYVVEEGWNFTPNPAHLHIAADTVVRFTGTKITEPTDPTGPKLEGDVVVSGGQMLHISENGNIKSMTIKAGGVVTFAPDKNIELKSTGNIHIEPGGKLVCSTSTGNHTITFHSFDHTKTVGGGHDMLPTDIGLWNFGSLILNGAPKKEYTFCGNAYKGQTFVNVEDATGWKVGDEINICITINPTGLDRGKLALQFERRTITKIEGLLIHFKEPLLYDHLAVVGEKTWKPMVENLTRSVTIQGTPTSRAHIFIRTQQHCEISYAASKYMGIFNVPDGKGGTKNSGRYALHFHHCMEGVRGLEVKGYVCDDINSHCFVPHVSHGITFTDCIAHNYTLPAYWWDETEITNDVTYQGCVASLGSLFDFLFGMGDGLVARKCIVIAGGLYRGNTRALGGAFHWEANNEGIWIFEDCLAIACGCGMRVWQNTSMNHLQDKYEAVNCFAGVFHGAYFNSYTYKDCIFHNAQFVGKATSSHTSGVRLERCLFDGGGKLDYLVSYSDSPIAVDNWNNFINCEFRGYKIAPVNLVSSKPANPDGTSSVARTTKKYEFVNPVFNTDNPFVWEPDVENGTIVRVQKDGKAYQIEKVGTPDLSIGTLVKKEIPLFAPDLWHDGYGWKGEYFNGTKDFEPAKKVFERVDNIIAFAEWAVRHNRPIAVHHKITGYEYCIRWTAKLMAQATGEHLFKINAGGGIRMWIDGNVVFDDWVERFDGSDRFMPAPVKYRLEKGKAYNVKIEFYNANDKSGITVLWKRPGETSFGIIPQSEVFPL